MPAGPLGEILDSDFGSSLLRYMRFLWVFRVESFQSFSVQTGGVALDDFVLVADEVLELFQFLVDVLHISDVVVLDFAFDVVELGVLAFSLFYFSPQDSDLLLQLARILSVFIQVVFQLVIVLLKQQKLIAEVLALLFEMLSHSFEFLLVDGGGINFVVSVHVDDALPHFFVAVDQLFEFVVFALKLVLELIDIFHLLLQNFFELPYVGFVNLFALIFLSPQLFDFAHVLGDDVLQPIDLSCQAHLLLLALFLYLFTFLVESFILFL